jgi:dTDP-4-dehydrorhamnose reductase
MAKILVTGGTGQLGQSIKRLANQYPNFEFTFPERDVLDLTEQKSIADYFNQHSFQYIINCAAYTAVDKAESEPENADQINHRSVEEIEKIAKKQNSTLIHISTDYVFNGQSFKPYTEDNKTSPTSVYGLTKLHGEQAVLEQDSAGCIIRTSWVYSEYGNNFVKTMLKLGKERDSLGVIFDQVGTPTYALDLAQAIMDIVIENEESGILSEDSPEQRIFHFSNEGVCSWYDFAKAIFEISGVDCHVNPIETKDYPTPAKRPHYSVLNKAKIKSAFGIEIPYWKDSLSNCLQRLKEQN